MNWGNRLIVVFVVFGLLIGAAVYKAINTQTDLVSKDYYKEELRYQDKLDGIVNANKLSDVLVTAVAQKVCVRFPKEIGSNKVSGQIHFYCVSDAKKDRNFTIDANTEGQQCIATSSLFKVSYQVKIQWKVANTSYYSEQVIHL
jgi:hypothetical protein